MKIDDWIPIILIFVMFGIGILYGIGLEKNMEIRKQMKDWFDKWGNLK